MIEISGKCGHLRDCVKGIAMRVIAGFLIPGVGESFAIPCPDCGKVCVLVKRRR